MINSSSNPRIHEYILVAGATLEGPEDADLLQSASISLVEALALCGALQLLSKSEIESPDI
jgi:hypothetical protein